jgi:hypothetical protein
MRVVDENHVIGKNRGDGFYNYGVRVDKKKGPIRYEISISALDGAWSCTCYDFIYRRAEKGEHCKHIDFVAKFHAMKKLHEVDMRRSVPKRFLGLNGPVRVFDYLRELTTRTVSRIK